MSDTLLDLLVATQRSNEALDTLGAAVISHTAAINAQIAGLCELEQQCRRAGAEVRAQRRLLDAFAAARGARK